VTRRAAPLALLLVLGACAQTAITWRAEERFDPLPEGAAVRLYVRSTAPAPVREALLARGAEEVPSFPDGERVAEISAREATWIPWDAVLDEVRERARALGADGAMATGGASAGPAEHVVWFQLVRSGRGAE